MVSTRSCLICRRPCGAQFRAANRDIGFGIMAARGVDVTHGMWPTKKPRSGGALFSADRPRITSIAPDRARTPTLVCVTAALLVFFSQTYLWKGSEEFVKHVR